MPYSRDIKEKSKSAGSKKREESRGIYRNLTLISQFTLYMLVPIGGCSALGYFLDKHFGTSFIIIIGFFIGAIAGGQSVYRLAMKIAREKPPEKEHHIINRRKSKASPDENKERAEEKDDDGIS